jgi:hypothetical protein
LFSYQVVLLRRQISLIGFAKIQNFSARHIEDALHMTLLNKRRHVEFGHSNGTLST